MGWSHAIDFCIGATITYCQQERSHAIYQHDAACRVRARLEKQWDEARVLLSQAERQIPMSMASQTADHAAPLSSGKRAAEDEEMGTDGKRIRPVISSSIISELPDSSSLISELPDSTTALSQQRIKRHAMN